MKSFFDLFRRFNDEYDRQQMNINEAFGSFSLRMMYLFKLNFIFHSEDLIFQFQAYNSNIFSF